MALETQKIQSDYITLAKNYYMLTNQFRKDIDKELDIEYLTQDLDGDSIEPLDPEIVMKILQEGKEVKCGERPKKESASQSPRCEIVAKTLKKYLDVRALVATR